MPPHTLTAGDVDLFKEQGYLGPFELCSPDEMDAIRPEIEHLLEVDPPDHNARVHNRHLDQPLIHRLAADPAILDRLCGIFGPDLLLWRTNFFVKHPGGKEIPWHQDFNYWPLEPPIIGSAWIAIDPATVENSCVQMIPGSHRKVIPHVKARADMEFAEMAAEDYYDTSNVVNLEMQPGQFVLFNERTLHHSEPNRSDKRRIGLAVRIIVPIVKVLSWDSPNHALVQLRGEDPMGFNRHTRPPA